MLNIEGQRILSVLNEVNQKMELLRSIPDNPDRRLVNVLGQENLEALLVLPVAL